MYKPLNQLLTHSNQFYDNGKINAFFQVFFFHLAKQFGCFVSVISLLTKPREVYCRVVHLYLCTRGLRTPS